MLACNGAVFTNPLGRSPNRGCALGYRPGGGRAGQTANAETPGKGSAFPSSFYISERANENPRPCPLGGELRARDWRAVSAPLPSPPWGRGWTATRALTSGGGPGEGVQAQRAYPTASMSNTSGLLGFGRRLAKLARFVNLSRRACQGTCLALGIWSFHGFDPLTRPAPAGESAGCRPPSPPKGRGQKIS